MLRDISVFLFISVVLSSKISRCKTHSNFPEMAFSLLTGLKTQNIRIMLYFQFRLGGGKLLKIIIFYINIYMHT